jgi:chaperonin cofactor prefoldin
MDNIHVTENPIASEISDYIQSNLTKTTMLGDEFAYILTQKSHPFLKKFKLTEAKKQAEKILTEIMKLEQMLKENEHFNES